MFNNAYQQAQDLFKRISGGVSNAVNDNRGFVQQGRFSAQPVQNFVQQRVVPQVQNYYRQQPIQAQQRVQQVQNFVKPIVQGVQSSPFITQNYKLKNAPFDLFKGGVFENVEIGIPNAKIALSDLNKKAGRQMALYQAHGQGKLSTNELIAKTTPFNTNLVMSAGLTSPVKGVVRNVVKNVEAKLPKNVVPPDDFNIGELLKVLKGKRGLQEKMYSQERASRFAKVKAVGEKMEGEQGYYKQLGQMKGALPKIRFEEIRSSLKPQYVDSLFNKVEGSQLLNTGHKLEAKSGLVKTLQGQVPTYGELDKMGRVFGSEVVNELLSKRDVWSKIGEGVMQSMGLQRALMATADFSMTLRQGALAVARHPIMAAKNMIPQFKAAFSPKAFQEINEEIIRRPTYRLMSEHNLALSSMDNLLQQREEQFMSTWAEKIPIVGKIVEGSNRAAVTFLNKMRADIFDDFIRQGKQLGIHNDPHFLDSMAGFVNAATGRGNLGSFARYAPLVNSVFFSPRLIASRLYFFNPRSYTQMHPLVRKEAVKSLTAFISAGLTTLALFKAGGAGVGVDPRSADFGKIRIGDTRVDIWAGFQQYIRAASQIYTGTLISSTTGKETTLGEGFGSPTRLGIAGRFLESKLNPSVGLGVKALRGKNFEGEPFDPVAENVKNLFPLVWKDAYETVREQGLDKGILLSLPAIFGIGVQTYGYKPLSKKEKEKAQLLKDQGIPEREVNNILLEEKKQKVDIEKQKKEVETTQSGITKMGIGGDVQKYLDGLLGKKVEKPKPETRVDTYATIKGYDKYYQDKTPQDPILKAKWNKQRKTAAAKLYYDDDPTIKDIKNQLLKKLGVTRSEVEFQAIKSLDNTEKASVVGEILSKRGFAIDKIDKFISEGIITADLIDKMVEQGIVKAESAGLLKGYVKQYNKGKKLKTGGAGRVGRPRKPKKLKLPKVTFKKAPGIGKFKDIRVKLPKATKFKMPNVKGLSSSELQKYTTARVTY